MPPTLLTRISEDLDKLEHELLEECVAMVRYAGLCGVQLPGEALSAAAVAWHRVKRTRGDQDGERLPLLTVAHRQLAVALAPASARVAVLSCRAAMSGKRFRLLGLFPLTRGLALVGLLSLLGLIAVHLAQRSSQAPDPWSALTGSVSAAMAAAAGASFMTLVHVGRDSVDRSFDPSRPAPYLAHFFITLAAGAAASAGALQFLGSSFRWPAGAALLAFTGAVLTGWLIRSTSKFLTALFSRPNAGVEPASGDGDLESRVDLVRALLVVQRRLATGTQLTAIRRDLSQILERMPVTPSLPDDQPTAVPGGSDASSGDCK